ncbi:DNA-directed RNA polymerase I subunit RPA34 [Oryzias latipes]|uniref:CD3e molecule, epsilon associated protein n=1 Tax=Oryzias latipes TaxID=8090 RepID=H2L7F1_ORYLA|nr:DNA-directed RNA polymerase I subunit RPA34 [Oryzias latipes]
MPKDVSSSSSSEDEAENPAPETAEPPKQPGKTLRFHCSSDFVTFRHVACSGAATDALKDDQKELWLIKAPVSFDPRRFSGIKVPLSGLRTVKVPGSEGPERDHQIYSVLASRRSASELRLLTCDPQDQLVLAPPFSGQLNVCESYGDSSTNQNPQVIPASPAPSVPPGLKQRFLPFGSRTPTLTEVGEEEVEGTMRPLVAAEGGGSGDEEEGRKRRKKKRIKTEEEVEVKQEPVDEPPKKRKKKKKKREMEEGLAAGVEVKAEPLSVKLEPPDAWCDGAPASGKKKKKKKALL